jgi:hypothetical protein
MMNSMYSLLSPSSHWQNIVPVRAIRDFMSSLVIPAVLPFRNLTLCPRSSRQNHTRPGSMTAAPIVTHSWRLSL